MQRRCCFRVEKLSSRVAQPHSEEEVFVLVEWPRRLNFINSLTSLDLQKQVAKDWRFAGIAHGKRYR